MVFPNSFQTTSPPAIASYDWRELSTGTAYKIFYASRYYIIDSGLTTTYSNFLTEQQTSNIEANYISSPSASNDYDFDITFTRPGYVKGTAYIKSTFSQYAGSVTKFHIIYTIYHVEGVTETSLGTFTNYGNAGTLDYFEQTIPIEITGKKFKFGDKLRLNIQIINDTGTADVRIFVDPSGSTFTDGGNTYSRDLQLHIPFKIIE